MREFRGNNYKPWFVSDTDFPRDKSVADQAQYLVNYAVLAANSHNTQPWKFNVNENIIELIPDFSRALPLSDPLNRQFMISLGCALGNLIVAAEHFGFEATISYYKGADVVASVTLQHQFEIGKYAVLFPAITQRRINRFPYNRDQLIAPNILAEFQTLNNDPEITLSIISESGMLLQMLNLVEQSTLGTQGNQGIVDEWTYWMRSRYTRQPDGLPLSADFGFPGPLSLIAPYMFKHSSGDDQARATKKLFATAPAFFVLAGVDDQEHWLRAGVILTFLALDFTRRNISYAPWGAVVEHKPSVLKTQELLKIERPLFFGRLGYTKKVPPHSPRRPPQDVLIKSNQRLIANQQ